MKINKLRFRLLETLDNLVACIHWYFSDERHDPYLCTNCGSTNVQRAAWVRPNHGNEYIEDVGGCETDKGDCWCDEGEGNHVIKPHKEFMKDILQRTAAGRSGSHHGTA